MKPSLKREAASGKGQTVSERTGQAATAPITPYHRPGYAALHNAHQTIGNRAVQRMVTQAIQPERQAAGRGGPEGAVVQRMMDVSSFKKSTAVSYTRRSKIKRVDKALAAYNKLGEREYAKRSAGLGAVINECDTYLAHPKAHPNRVPGITELRDHAGQELVVMDLLTDADNQKGADKFLKLYEAQEAWLLVKNSVPRLGSYDINKILFDSLQELRSTPGETEKVLQNELDQLEEIMNDDDTPDITKRALREILGNLDEVHMNAMLPGARFTNEKEKQDGVTEKYVVNHNLNAPGGSAERLGSLAHELTHVSISEQFGNTALFFAFDPGTSDDDVMALVDKRHQDLDNLIAAMNSGGFKKEQADLLRMKLDYPRKGGSGGVLKYVSSFFQSKKITQEEKEQAEALVARGMDNTVIEFDTVINQMLIYMHQWKIPQDNPFYVLLQSVAQDAYDHRMG